MFDFMSRGFDLRTQTVFVKGKHWKRPIFALEPSKNVYNDPLTEIKYALPSLVQDGPNINHTGSNIGKTEVYPYALRNLLTIYCHFQYIVFGDNISVCIAIYWYAFQYIGIYLYIVTKDNILEFVTYVL